MSSDSEHSGRSRQGERGGRGDFESVVPDLVKRILERALESGVEKLNEGKEAGHYFYQQVDETKKGVYRVVAKEIRDVLEQTNFAEEISEVLTKLQFEITTQIRFVPNDASSPPDDDANPPQP